MANQDTESESESTEFQSGDEIFTGFVSGLTFKNKPVQYTVVDGLALFEGDIVLGTAEEMKSRTQAKLAGDDIDATQDDLEMGVAVSGAQYRWPSLFDLSLAKCLGVNSRFGLDKN